MERAPEQVLQYLTEAEAAAEKVLTDKRHLIESDRRRQKIREAIGALQREKSSDKSLMCFNNLYLELPKERVKKWLEKEFNVVDAEIDRVREGLKPLVNRLRDIEYKEDAPGFNLNPLTRQELDSLRNYM